MSNTKIYLFNQNNSGGSFDTHDLLCHRVGIEAASRQEANDTAEDIGIYFYGIEDGLDCPCCGDRWYPVSEYDTIDKEGAVEHLQKLADGHGWPDKDGVDARIIYLDGTVKEIKVREKSN